jgi:hypothetical protein
MILGFTAALFIGTAAIAGWIAIRFPKLAPESLVLRVVGVVVTAVVLRLEPIATGGSLLLFVTVFGLALVLLAVWLSALWMLQGVRDLLG